jgi:hypothetical protein
MEFSAFSPAAAPTLAPAAVRSAAPNKPIALTIPTPGMTAQHEASGESSRAADQRTDCFSHAGLLGGLSRNRCRFFLYMFSGSQQRNFVGVDSIGPQILKRFFSCFLRPKDSRDSIHFAPVFLNRKSTQPLAHNSTPLLSYFMMISRHPRRNTWDTR